MNLEHKYTILYLFLILGGVVLKCKVRTFHGKMEKKVNIYRIWQEYHKK